MNESRRALDSHRDVYKWPYEWSREIHPDVISELTKVSLLYDELDFWTYNNHKALLQNRPEIYYDLLVDIYWQDERGDRLQLPIPVGDDVSRRLVQFSSEYLTSIVWNYEVWTPQDGWNEYAGPQGDFVTHIHTEWIEPDGYEPPVWVWGP